MNQIAKSCNLSRMSAVTPGLITLGTGAGCRCLHSCDLTGSHKLAKGGCSVCKVDSLHSCDLTGSHKLAKRGCSKLSFDSLQSCDLTGSHKFAKRGSSGWSSSCLQTCDLTGSHKFAKWGVCRSNILLSLLSLSYTFVAFTASISLAHTRSLPDLASKFMSSNM